MKGEKYHIIGVMSGTSLDGIDLAELNFTLSNGNRWDFEIVNAETIPYPEVWKQKLQKAVSYPQIQLEALNIDYTNYLAQVILAFIKKYDIIGLNAVCSHGHTILHRPELGITLQIGNLAPLAKLIKQTVVCDFRIQDVALGGQGAPLVPIGDRLLFSEYSYCLNLGGFANCSFENEKQRIAYDICPVNIVLNKLSEELGFPFDEGGKIAKAGTINQPLLSVLNKLEFYDELPPKSLGLEWVQKNVLPILNQSDVSVEDKLNTFTEHIAMQIGRQFEEDKSVLVTGGGSYNDYLLSRINYYSSVLITFPSKQLIEFKEALIFGLLGVLKLRNEVNCLSSVTGAKMDHSSGRILLV